MRLIDHIVEQRIARAIAAGEFTGLPGEGKPLVFNDDRLVPEELRVAHRILKNAGFLPPALETRREIAAATELARHAADDPSRRRALVRLALLSEKLAAEGRALPHGGGYYERIVERLAR